MRVVLQTARVMLRRFTVDDGDLLFDLHNDRAVMRYLNGGRPISRNTIAEETLPSLLAHDAAHEAYGTWAAVDIAHNAFFGWFALQHRRTEDREEAELGYRLHRST